jgi:hypothetical protein
VRFTSVFPLSALARITGKQVDTARRQATGTPQSKVLLNSHTSSQSPCLCHIGRGTIGSGGNNTFFPFFYFILFYFIFFFLAAPGNNPPITLSRQGIRTAYMRRRKSNLVKGLFVVYTADFPICYCRATPL